MYFVFVVGEKWVWLWEYGIWFFLVVGWVECGGYIVIGYGNLVLWFYIVWGIGLGIVEFFIKIVCIVVVDGFVELCFWYWVDKLIVVWG